MNDRPEQVFDPAVQHERTALAWERTALASIVAGALFVAHARTGTVAAFLPAGLAFVAYGTGLLAWAGRHYEELHGVLRRGAPVTHPNAVRAVGLATTVFTVLAVIVGVLSL